MSSSTTTNPLLTNDWLPHFSAIKPTDIEPAVRQVLSENRATLNELLKKGGSYTWDNLMAPLEELSDRLSAAWSPVAHLNGVRQSDVLRDAYNACLPLLTEYSLFVMQNEPLYQAVTALAQSPLFGQLELAQQKAIEYELRDFRLYGVHLSADKKTQFLELEKKVSQLTSKFSENVLDATQGWYLSISDPQQLKGLPDFALEMATQNAQTRKLEGSILTLDAPSYSASMKFLDDRRLREQLYEAFCTRASDQGPNADTWDNTPVMEELLHCRYELAGLLDFPTYADYSLATKMAKQPETVMTFLNELLSKSKPFAEKDMTELKAFAAAQGGPSELAPWDLAYYGEKLRQSQFNFSEQDIKPYFPIAKVLQGLFKLVNTLYGLKIKEGARVETWHPDVQFFEIFDDDDQFRGAFYIDLFARLNKREGAWMDDCRNRRRLRDGSIQHPVAYLTCNFTPPLGELPALLSHDEVLTLFHEFGHCLQHLLTTVDYSAVSGLHNVPWDVVEFPSQFMELWFWEKEVVNWISGHYKTGEPLPDPLYQQLLAAKNFHSGLHLQRQLEFALFDFRLHWEYDPKKKHQIQNILNEVREKTALLPIPAYNRFQNTFSHVFAGGYSAGYYSYTWADVLSCDAYAHFKEHGLFDRAIGESFMQNVLEPGGVHDAMETFVAFRGHKPELDALLRQNGLVST